MLNLIGARLWVLFTLLSWTTTTLASPLPPVVGPRQFDLTLTWTTYNADGKDRRMILVNGEFPGPLLEINEGEQVDIWVHNQLPYNTTVHFHGIVVT
jgi:FtsP/CotA-like multicopper oxidase with cupredoxin domain